MLITMEPRHPKRFEKKKNTYAARFRLDLVAADFFDMESSAILSATGSQQLL